MKAHMLITFLLLMQISIGCTNFVEVNNTLNAIKASTKKAEKNHRYVSERYLAEMEGLNYVIEGNRSTKIDLIKQNSGVPTTDEDKNKLIDSIVGVYDKEKEQKDALRKKIDSTREGLNKNLKNFENTYILTDALMEYMDFVDRGRPSNLIKEFRDDE